MLHRSLLLLLAGSQLCAGTSHDLCVDPPKGAAAVERPSLLQTSAMQGLKSPALDEAQEVVATASPTKQPDSKPAMSTPAPKEKASDVDASPKNNTGHEKPAGKKEATPKGLSHPNIESMKDDADQGVQLVQLEERVGWPRHNTASVQQAGPVALADISSRSTSNSRIFSVGRSDGQQSQQRTKDTSTLFYHVHLPKTGGTTVANLLVADVCSPFADATPRLEWDKRCSTICQMGLTDNQFSCNAGREGFEHHLLSLQTKRAEFLKAESGAQSVIYVTTLRRGSERLISQWAHEVRNKVFVPSTGVPAYSNESLQLYITGDQNGKHDHRNGKGWINAGYVSQRNNLQVAQLASVDPWLAEGVTRKDLELAKQRLFTGMWVVGFMKCMDKVQDKLELYGTSLHRGFIRKPAPVTNPSPTLSKFAFNQQTLSLLDRHCALDNELYDWAWGMAQNPEFKQFAGTC